MVRAIVFVSVSSVCLSLCLCVCVSVPIEGLIRSGRAVYQMKALCTRNTKVEVQISAELNFGRKGPQKAANAILVFDFFNFNNLW